MWQKLSFGLALAYHILAEKYARFLAGKIVAKGHALNSKDFVFLDSSPPLEVHGLKAK
jgi:hypothetical protein